MDLNPEDLITALPAESVIKTALTAIGTNANLMQPTDELFVFINAYEEVQTAYNAGTQPGTISTVGNAVIEIPLFDGEGNLGRNIRRQIQFKQNFEISEINPIIL